MGKGWPGAGWGELRSPDKLKHVPRKMAKLQVRPGAGWSYGACLHDRWLQRAGRRLQKFDPFGASR